MQQQQFQQQPQQQSRQQLNQSLPQQQRVPQTIFPKQANVAFTGPVGMVNKSFNGAVNNSLNNTNGLASFGGTGVTVAATSPGTSSAENNSLSPVPYVLNRGRRSNNGLEKVIERRQRRMIKNRESAARSRARKQVSSNNLTKPQTCSFYPETLEVLRCFYLPLLINCRLTPWNWKLKLKSSRKLIKNCRENRYLNRLPVTVSLLLHLRI